MRPEKLDLEERHWDRVFAPSSGVAIVTTCDGDGRINAAAYGSCTRVSHSPVYLAFTAYAAHDTVANLAAVPEFTVNLPRFDKALLAKLQTVGLPFARGVNELDKAGLTASPPPRCARRASPNARAISNARSPGQENGTGGSWSSAGSSPPRSMPTAWTPEIHRLGPGQARPHLRRALYRLVRAGFRTRGRRTVLARPGTAGL